nr:uncharacterized protein LOC129415491 [Misgurnus anguillicaudatus]
MECYFSNKDFNLIVWYKQVVGKPQPIVMSYNYGKNVLFLKGFEDGHFSVTAGIETYNLNIFKVKLEDVATYYCGVIKTNALAFGFGTFLMITGKQLDTRRILQQPHLTFLYLGDNITLKCTVKFMEEKTCSQNNVYWLKQSIAEVQSKSKKSKSYIDRAYFIMTAELGAVTKTCIYNYTITNLTISNVGTYYCAVDVDGEIIIGNGTKISITDMDLRLNYIFVTTATGVRTPDSYICM